jgi:gliding motility-associated protein GldC
MTKHSISINVLLDNQNLPEHIDWQASGSAESTPQQAKAFMASFWDPKDRTALRMDLWTKKMMVDEMNDFFFQTLMTMADTYVRATRDEDLSKELKEFAKEFKKKADQKVMEDNQKQQSQQS